jgi:hypothetical protein
MCSTANHQHSAQGILQTCGSQSTGISIQQPPGYRNMHAEASYKPLDVAILFCCWTAGGPQDLPASALPEPAPVLCLSS